MTTTHTVEGVTKMPSIKDGFRFDINALMLLEDAGIHLLNGLEPEQFKDFKVLQVLVWAGLIHRHPNLTHEDARTIMGSCFFGELVDAITAAVKEAMGSEDDEESDASSAVEKD